MIHRPAKKQLKRIMLEIALGKKLSSKQFLNILNMDTIILTIGVTEHTSAKLIEIQKSSLQTKHGLHEPGG